MIIRATFNDNDFTQILEEFFKYFKFKNYNLYYKDCVDLKEYKDRVIESEDLLEKIIYNADKMTKTDKQRFIYIVTESIKVYIKTYYMSDYTYLVDKLKVTLRKQVDDNNENGEVVYHFINKDIYITA